jgi:acetyltransferase-like isoleucine patch superfamily enzyme
MKTKLVFKKIAFVIALVLTAPFSFGSWIEKRFTGNEAAFVTFGQLLSLVPGMIGAYLRAAYVFASSCQSSWEVHIGFGSFLSHRSASIGRHVAIGSYCVIGYADIGEEVMIASRVSIPSGKRQHIDEYGRLSNEAILERVSIGDKSWIGEGAIVLASVGGKCIISAGAVVTFDVPANCVVGGNPGRVIKRIDNPSRKESE